MEIKRDGFVYRVSHLTTSRYDMPDQVSACSLIWRLPFFFCLWAFVALMVWTILGPLAFLSITAVLTLVGKRMKLDPEQEAATRDVCDTLMLPGTNLFTRVSFLSYDLVPIQNRFLKWVGPVILSIGILSWIIKLCVEVVQMIGPDIAEFVGRIPADSWWIATGEVVFILLFLTYFPGRRAYRAVRATELGQLVSAYYRAKKEKFCPVIKVV